MGSIDDYRINLIPTLPRLPFDKLRPRASRGELAEGRIPHSDFWYLFSDFCSLTSGSSLRVAGGMKDTRCWMADARYLMLDPGCRIPEGGLNRLIGLTEFFFQSAIRNPKSQIESLDNVTGYRKPNAENLILITDRRTLDTKNEN